MITAWYNFSKLSEVFKSYPKKLIAIKQNIAYSISNWTCKLKIRNNKPVFKLRCHFKITGINFHSMKTKLFLISVDASCPNFKNSWSWMKSKITKEMIRCSLQSKIWDMIIQGVPDNSRHSVFLLVCSRNTFFRATTPFIWTFIY